MIGLQLECPFKSLNTFCRIRYDKAGQIPIFSLLRCQFKGLVYELSRSLLITTLEGILCCSLKRADEVRCFHEIPISHNEARRKENCYLWGFSTSLRPLKTI